MRNVTHSLTLSRPKSLRLKFKLGGADGSGTYRAVMIHGPPGIGKTSAAHLVAKLEGYDVVESNASDTRSKKLLDASFPRDDDMNIFLTMRRPP